MRYLIVTDHAEDRFRERVKLPRRTVTKRAAHALERGITHAEATGPLRRYFDMLYQQSDSANNIRIYCNTVYVFYYDTLVTVFPLPQRLRKIAEKISRRKREQQDVY